MNPGNNTQSSNALCQLNLKSIHALILFLGLSNDRVSEQKTGGKGDERH